MIRRLGLAPRQIVLASVGLLAVLAAVAVFAFRDDILRASIDPKTPFQTYRPPPAPDWTKPSGWLLIPTDPDHFSAADGPADVFFVHPTTFDSPKQWNAPVGDARAQKQLQTEILPNYAGPFARVGRVFAPQYRQATLFSLMTFREDARDARALAYGDVKTAFQVFHRRWDRGRPLVLVGVREGAVSLARLLREDIATDPALLHRLAGVYLIDAAVPAEGLGPGSATPACTARDQARCVVGWLQAIGEGGPGLERRLDHAAAWSGGELQGVKGRPLLCVNPILGVRTDAEAPKRLHRGAANATGLEWGTRPALMSREVSAQCRDGVLHVSRPASGALQPSGSWVDRRKAQGFELFWADLEADAQARVRALLGTSGVSAPAPAITTTISVRRDPLRRIPGR